MLVCPLDFRYGSELLRAIFSEDNRLKRLLAVESALAAAQAEVGVIKKEHALEINRCASIEKVSVQRVKALENEVKHDLMAVVLALTEQCNAEAGKYVHLGATSNDIIDTATALQLKEASNEIRERLIEFEQVLLRRADEHRNTIMLGRTHGQAALPITFGLKLAVFAAEVQRHILRLDECQARVCVGKMTGAVGTGAAQGPRALEIEARVMESLGLKPELAAAQIIGRDRYAELICVLGNLASSLEKFATEVRNLQRTELAEAAEAFEITKQVGSSTMAQKQNPITAENICGLARIVRGFVIPAFENIPLWHERDLTNSSSERFILPHVCILTEQMLRDSIRVFTNLRVFPERMRDNLDRAGSQIMAEAVIIALVNHGMGRQDAHERVRKCAQLAQPSGKTFRAMLEEDHEIGILLPPSELRAALDPTNYLGSANEIIDRVRAARSN